MGSSNSDLLERLQGAIAGWTDEVGTAQQKLSVQIDGANSQLGHLLKVLRDRNGHALTLAEANAEIERLKQAMSDSGLSPGSVSSEAAHGAKTIDLLRQELSTTLERLHDAVQSWTTEVSQSQNGLGTRFDDANTQLHRLLDILAESESPQQNGKQTTESRELAQLRHERDILISEVRTLNIEVESLRDEQQRFASANRNAESERDRKKQLDIEGLQAALAERDEIIDECQSLLDESQRIEESLTRDIGTLEKRVAVLTQSETQLQETVAQQRLESEKHNQALSGLGQEMEGIRQALSSAKASAAPDSGNSSDALETAQARISALELEVEVLSDRPERSELDEAAARIAALEQIVAEGPALAEEAPPTLSEDKDATTGLVEELEAAQAALNAANDAIARLEADRAVFEDDIVASEADPVLDGAHEAALEALEEKIAALETELEAATAKLIEAENPEASGGIQVAAEVQGELENSLAQLEGELATLKQRENGNVETARTLLKELETHRTFEMAQATSLAELRAEAEALREALEEKTAAMGAMEQAHGAALEEAQNAADGLRASLEKSQADLAALQDALDAAQARIESLEESASDDEKAQAQGQQELIERHSSEIQAYRDSQSEMEKRLAELEVELVHARDVQTAHDDLKSRYDALVGEKEGLLAEAEERSRDLEASRKDVAAGEATMGELRADLEALKKQVSEAVTLQEMFSEESSSAAAKLEELEAEREKLSAEVARLEEALAVNGAALEASEAAQKSADDTVEELGAARETLNGEVARLEAALAAQRTDLESSEAARQNASDSLESLEMAHETATLEVARLEEELAIKSSALEAGEGALGRANADLEELESTREKLSAEIDRLQGELAAELAARQDREAAYAAEASARAEAEETLNSTRQQASALLEERAQIASALDEVSAKSAAQEASLAEATSTLEAQQALLQQRDEEINAFRIEVGTMGAQLKTLVDEESEAKRQAEHLKGELDDMRASDALHAEDLEKSRLRLEQMRREYEHQQEAFNALSARGEELEKRLTQAKMEELSALSAVGELEEEVEILQEKEKMESQALEETRKLVSSHQAALLDREDRVSKLETQLASVLAEKEALSAQTEAQVAEMQATVAQVSDAISERDELRDALANSAVAPVRVSMGEAGLGTTLAEALAAREQHTRQQDILLSELTQTDGNRSLGDILVDAEVLTRKQLNKALAIQAKDPSQLLGTVLIEHEFATDDAIAQAVACQLGKSVVNPMEVHIQPQAVSLLNGDICTWHVCIPLRVTGDRLVVAMANPLDESAIFKLRDISQREITPVVGAASQIMDAIDAHYGTF